MITRSQRFSYDMLDFSIHPALLSFLHDLLVFYRDWPEILDISDVIMKRRTAVPTFFGLLAFLFISLVTMRLKSPVAMEAEGVGLALPSIDATKL